MRYTLILCLTLLSLPGHAGDCNFNTQSGTSLQCGMTKADLENNLGRPLFYNDNAAARNAASQPADNIVENWVYRLTNSAGVQKMVSVKLVDGKIRDIIISR